MNKKIWRDAFALSLARFAERHLHDDEVFDSDYRQTDDGLSDDSILAPAINALGYYYFRKAADDLQALEQECESPIEFVMACALAISAHEHSEQCFLQDS
jgi:hypothetical protein